MIAITGANGRLGRQTIAHLRQMSPTEQIVAAVRRPASVGDVGIEVRRADYDDPASLRPALVGVQRLLLISGTEFGKRVDQHAAVVAAAVDAGVEHLVYTSAPRVDETDLVFGSEHLATETLVRQSGIPFTILRNNWYHENYAPTVVRAVSAGYFVGNAHAGRVASADRGDYAEAAARVLTEDGHEGAVYELAGDVAWSYDELAEAITAVAGRTVSYRDLSYDQHRESLAAAGATVGELAATAGIEDNIAHGALQQADGTLSRLVQHPTGSLVEAVRTFIHPTTAQWRQTAQETRP